MSECCVGLNSEKDFQSYWDDNFIGATQKNWVETEEPFVLSWIKEINLPKSAKIFCAGVGDSNIVAQLLHQGYSNIIANDISGNALDRLKKKINSENVSFLLDDLIYPKKIQEHFDSIDLYIDRATLHFFTKCAEKDHYFSQLKKLLKTGGHSMLGVFSKLNTPTCCGLDLQLWSLESIKNRLPDFEHINESQFDFTEVNGSVRNYIYLNSQKI